ncbi:MAG: RNA-protein complex protein Nop10 [Candidatus Thermoplasmatota archaeon]|nr:RNA-protein complex protein Nop10 [Candidatus Thermoplasmatota archaeon]
MLICPKCEEYTLSTMCPKCKSPTRSPGPSKFSPEDRYGEYRRRLKKENANRGAKDD